MNSKRIDVRINRFEKVENLIHFRIDFINILKIFIISFTAFYLIGSFIPFYEGDDASIFAFASINLSEGRYDVTNDLLKPTASHFANDIAIGTRTGDDRPFRALSLADNAAVMTAIANDDGYDEIFVQQLQVLIRPGDVVVAISASGRSPNVIKAIEYANAHDAITVALTGFAGGRLKEIARHGVHVPTDEGEYGPVEDTHLILDHLVGAYLARRVRAAASG